AVMSGGRATYSGVMYRPAVPGGYPSSSRAVFNSCGDSVSSSRRVTSAGNSASSRLRSSGVISFTSDCNCSWLRFLTSSSCTSTGRYSNTVAAFSRGMSRKMIPSSSGGRSMISSAMSGGSSSVRTSRSSSQFFALMISSKSAWRREPIMGLAILNAPPRIGRIASPVCDEASMLATPMSDRLLLFVCPATNTPSGGIRMIYRQVDMLNRHGFHAFVVHDQPGFRCDWFENSTPILDPGTAAWTPRDIIAAPELASSHLFDGSAGIPKVIFNQKCYSTFFPWPDDAALARIAYLRPDVIAAIVVSQDSEAYLRYAFPRLTIHRLHYSIDPA